jgi:hypothetical protein
MGIEKGAAANGALLAFQDVEKNQVTRAGRVPKLCPRGAFSAFLAFLT